MVLYIIMITPFIFIHNIYIDETEYILVLCINIFTPFIFIHNINIDETEYILLRRYTQ